MISNFAYLLFLLFNRGFPYFVEVSEGPYYGQKTILCVQSHNMTKPAWLGLGLGTILTNITYINSKGPRGAPQGNRGAM